MALKLKSEYSPAGDQEKAIKRLVDGLNNGDDSQVLLGVTGSGKTFTIANVLEKVNRPAIILSHNKTLAAQLYSEVKTFFPENKVEYFVSHFDYYRPEAYKPGTDTYIDKTSKSNWDLDMMRMATLNSLLSDRGTIVVASVASIYGALNPQEYKEMFYVITTGDVVPRKELLRNLVARNYKRNNVELRPGNFRAKGDVIEIAPGWTDEYIIRLDIFGDEIEEIAYVDSLSGKVNKIVNRVLLFPADSYTTRQETVKEATTKIRAELEIRVKELEEANKLLEAQRLSERVHQDLEHLEEFGVCPGIENYSLYMDGREYGQTPYTIFDYIPKDTVIIIDESHMMIPQVKGMFKADRSRKETLVEYGFRLPSAMENRPLNFDEFERLPHQKIFVSATPNEYEIDKAEGVVVEQIIRPTGLLDPIIEVIPKEGQIEDMYDRIKTQIKNNERTFVLTTTIRMAEELTRYFQEKGIKTAYIHNELKTFERAEVLRKLRKGIYDVVVGINLLREGIDIPEVSLILVIDADIESFMRTSKSLIQIAGRAARNSNGRVIFYANKISNSMEIAIDETRRRRQIQDEYNKEHGIIPTTIIKEIADPLNDNEISGAVELYNKKGKNEKAKKEIIDDLRDQMLRASKSLEFEKAARLRDLIIEMQEE
ncbi:excinuclease ABC subunit UvrB [Mycoplasma todarodis]|uniref:UvrABC system protein B n=1 Tax=Mycoplasma todarodis TaxID=1937191 RepID=A0A4R0XLY1_9MOLU|nr:excinuclease ABC subunit UvrB [Mycoplasma todarodis]TCG11514.1 excinuclease ABC subunit B [Mycoplasma todarodis]